MKNIRRRIIHYLKINGKECDLPFKYNFMGNKIYFNRWEYDIDPPTVTDLECYSNPEIFDIEKITYKTENQLSRLFGNRPHDQFVMKAIILLYKMIDDKYCSDGETLEELVQAIYGY